MPYHDTYHDAYIFYSDVLGASPMYFRPPTVKRYFEVNPGFGRLMARVPYEQGLAVLDVGGTITPPPGLEVVRQDQAAAADHVYYGGYVWGPLSDAEVTALTAAGYGAFLSTAPP